MMVSMSTLEGVWVRATQCMVVLLSGDAICVVDRQVADKQVYRYNKLKKGKGQPPAKQKVLMQKWLKLDLLLFFILL